MDRGIPDPARRGTSLLSRILRLGTGIGQRVQLPQNFSHDLLPEHTDASTLPLDPIQALHLCGKCRRAKR
jgi:hypothetical protein